MSRATATLLATALVLCTATVPAAPHSLVEQLHADGVEQFRAARFSAAYGRFVELADVRHEPSAHYALWMCLHGLELFGKDWDCTGEQLQDWSQLVGVPTPPLLARHYGRHVVAAAPARRQALQAPDMTRLRASPAGR